MSDIIPFNKPFLTGKETAYIEEAVLSGKISGDGGFTKRCHKFFEEQFGFKKVLLTTSCTDALEMAALLLDIQPGDEVIIPSYTFVSTPNAFVLRGAKVVFADSNSENPNVDPNHVRSLISPKSKAIVVVHYAGIACDMKAIMEIANEFGIYVVEDAAQAIDSYCKIGDSAYPLGGIGHLSAFSFHETKNVISGEGGMLVINDDRFLHRAEIIREKGTNRSAFFRGEVDKYGWVDVGSSFLPSDIIAAFLFAQLENLSSIQQRRREIWDHYYSALNPLAEKGCFRMPSIPKYATNNAHMFYLVCSNLEERTAFIEHCKRQNIFPVFHYLSLHKSPFYSSRYQGGDLHWADYYSDRLVRLPFFYGITHEEIERVVSCIHQFYS